MGECGAKLVQNNGEKTAVPVKILKIGFATYKTSLEQLGNALGIIDNHKTSWEESEISSEIINDYNLRELGASISKIVKTTDYWHSNYPDNCVKISLIYSKENEFVRLLVKGNDDCGYELNFKGKPEENVKKYEEWKNTLYENIPEPCTKDYFKNLGFTHI